MKSYRTIDVWKKTTSGTVIRFRCFQIDESSAYCVQSADIYHEPISEEQIGYLERQYIELLIEEDPEKRNGIYPTLEEAIAAHEKEFEEQAYNGK